MYFMDKIEKNMDSSREPKITISEVQVNNPAFIGIGNEVSVM